ncbi:MAG TPA: nuclear transport factor 2 family protein [Burkholderiaceae bacterium]
MKLGLPEIVVTAITALLLVSGCEAQTVVSAKDAPTPLFRRMEALENAMSEAFNRCDIEKLESFYDPRLEFYHDAAGATWTREQFINNVKRNACNRFHRHMVPGTLEVWPLGKFGAVYTGSYQACLVATGKCAVQGRVMMIVQNKDEVWTVTRVVSYDHRDLP